MFFLLALALVLLQLTGVWLRYLPFADTVSKRQRRNLQRLTAGWGIIAFLSYAAVMTVYDGDVLRFKLLVAFGWVPFFLIFRLVITTAHHMSEHTAEVNRNNLLAQQLYSLREYTRLTEEKRQTLRVLRHDMRHYNRLLGTLLDSGRIQEAKQLVDKYTAEIEHTTMQEFCANDLINATLSIYHYHLGNLEIPFQQKVNLPREMAGMDMDVAIVLSNLLENALHASMKQPVTDRTIKVSAQYDAGQYVLSVANRFRGSLLIDSEGLPYSDEPGHGTGMISLRAFVRKYKAQCDLRQQDGWVTVMLYWHGEK